jgi:uncharacterized membrane protein
MNDVIEVPESQQSLKTIGHISYFMHAVVAVGAVLPGVQASVLLLLLAFFLDMFKREDARGTWQESHFSWRIRTVVWAGVLYVVTWPLWLLFQLPGWIAWGIISIWFLYRIARGWLNLSSNRPMPA